MPVARCASPRVEFRRRATDIGVNNPPLPDSLGASPSDFLSSTVSSSRQPAGALRYMLQLVTVLRYFSGLLGVFIVAEAVLGTSVICWRSLFKGHRACFLKGVSLCAASAQRPVCTNARSRVMILYFGWGRATDARGGCFPFTFSPTCFT